MNPDYPKSFVWREMLFQQEEAGFDEFVRYRSGEYQLWKWGKANWAAKIADCHNSNTETPETALLDAVRCAVRCYFSRVLALYRFEDRPYPGEDLGLPP